MFTQLGIGSARSIVSGKEGNHGTGGIGRRSLAIDMEMSNQQPNLSSTIYSIAPFVLWPQMYISMCVLWSFSIQTSLSCTYTNWPSTLEPSLLEFGSHESSIKAPYWSDILACGMIVGTKIPQIAWWGPWKVFDGGKSHKWCFCFIDECVEANAIKSLKYVDHKIGIFLQLLK